MLGLGVYMLGLQKYQVAVLRKMKLRPDDQSYIVTYCDNQIFCPRRFCVKMRPRHICEKKIMEIK